MSSYIQFSYFRISIESQDLATISDLANISAGLNSHATYKGQHKPVAFETRSNQRTQFAWRIE